MQTYQDVARKAALAAGRIQQQKSGHIESIEFKGEINLVTEVDRACEKIIIDTIKGTYPDHDILAEEAGYLAAGKNLSQQRSSQYKWIIDPLDGTTNYTHGYPFYCVSIALEYESRTQVAVIYDPVRDELFEAARGQGAFLNGEAIRVSSIAHLKQALLVTGFAYDIQENTNNNLDHFANFILSSQAVRRDGTAALDLAYVACGRFDGFWELGLNPWDIAAGSLLIEEAQGTLSLLNGEPLNIYQKEIVASNGNIHPEMLKILSKRGR